MNKLFPLALILFSFCSCNSALEKPIITPLTEKELKTQSSTNEDFEYIYNNAEKMRSLIVLMEMGQEMSKEILSKGISKEVAKEVSKYKKVTYKDLVDYEKYKDDVSDQLTKEWDEQWNYYSDKLDSIVSYWKEYKKQNSVNSHVSIQLSTIDKNRKLGFEITPLKGKIDQLYYSYYFKSKNDKGDYLDDLSDQITQSKGCRVSTPFSSTITQYYPSENSDRVKLENKTVDQILDEYNLITNVIMIKANGKNLTDHTLNIPSSIASYMNEDDFMRDMYGEKVIQEFLDRNFLSQLNYIKEKSNELLRNYKPSVFELYKLIDVLSDL